MSGWMIPAAYLAGMVVCYRKAFVLFMESDARSSSRTLDAEDRALNACAAFGLSFMWPIAVAGYVLYRGFTPITPTEREHRIREREAQIARLERELGIEP